MKIGIAGRSLEDKSALFQILTQIPGDPIPRVLSQSVGVMDLPDRRLDWLSEVFHPRKTVYVRMDVQPILPAGGRDFLNACRDCDVLVAGVSAQSSQDVLDDIETEFIVSDLALIENRLERLGSNKAKPVSPMEPRFLQKCKDALDNDVILRNLTLESHEQAILSTFNFFTAIPLVVAVDVSEEHLSGGYPGANALKERCLRRGYPLISYCSALEEEIAALPEDDKAEFMGAYGLADTGSERVGRACYDALGYISFFTVGSDEVRAWAVSQGQTVKEAAGKIHSDMERGFIRAEVVSYQDFHEAGSFKRCKELGVLRVEGKNYVVCDGDIVDVRFNV